MELVPTAAAVDVVATVSVSNTIVHQTDLTKPTICLNFELHDHNQKTPQCISIELAGKTHRHTTVDHQGIIVSDVALEIKEFKIEHISVRDLFCSGQQCYQHNHNGASDWINDEFYGYMGFNGTVSFDFYSPIYLWIGEQFP